MKTTLSYCITTNIPPIHCNGSSLSLNDLALIHKLFTTTDDKSIPASLINPTSRLFELFRCHFEYQVITQSRHKTYQGPKQLYRLFNELMILYYREHLNCKQLMSCAGELPRKLTRMEAAAYLLVHHPLVIQSNNTIIPSLRPSQKIDPFHALASVYARSKPCACTVYHGITKLKQEDVSDICHQGLELMFPEFLYATSNDEDILGSILMGMDNKRGAAAADSKNIIFKIEAKTCRSFVNFSHATTTFVFHPYTVFVVKSWKVFSDITMVYVKEEKKWSTECGKNIHSKKKRKRNGEKQSNIEFVFK